MPSVKLTQTAINNTKYQGKGRGAHVLWDETTPGFGLRVQPSGQKSFVLAYRNADGRQRQLALGRYGALTLREARDLARRQMAAIKAGKDPAHVKIAQREAPTISDLAAQYLEKHANRKKERSRHEDERIIGKYVLPRLGTSKIGAVTRADISRLHNQIGKDSGQYMANRTLALLSKMFTLAEKWGLRPDATNPCRHVDRFKEVARERYLTEEEAARLALTLQEAENEGVVPIQAVWAIRLLLLTGARVSEILTLRWEYVDLDDRCLRLPDSKTGKKTIMLSDSAAALIANIPRLVGNPFIIHGHRARSHFVGLQRSWRKIKTAAELDDVRLHDLRHSYAAFAVSAGLSLVEIGALLGHTQAATTMRYSHLLNSQRRAATDAVGGVLDAVLQNGGSKGKVVPLRGNPG